MVTNRLIEVNYTKGRKGHQIRYLVLHTMVGTIQGTRSWFNNPSAKASAHFGVGFSGEIDRYVRESDTAWANGTRHSSAKPNLNYVSISIEAEDKGNPNDSKRTEELYQAMAWLIHRLCKKYNIPLKLTVPHGAPGLLLHRQSNTNKSCPGQLNISKLIKMAELIRSLEKRIDDSEVTLRQKDEALVESEKQKADAIGQRNVYEKKIIDLEAEINRLKTKPQDKPQTNTFNLFRFIYELLTKGK